MGRVRNFWRYLLGKRSEVRDLDVKDAVLTKVVIDIHRKRSEKRLVTAPLAALRRIHRLDRENALVTTRQRIKTLRGHRESLLSARVLSAESLGKVLPSVSKIKVVREGPDSFLAFEGNGRLAALQEVFPAKAGLEVEVEEYLFADPTKILRRLNRVRRLNGLLGTPPVYGLPEEG